MKTSSSVAFSPVGLSQIARDWLRQNCLVQSLHVRGVEDVLFVVSVGMEEEKGMMVEFVKQVHLQKVVGAEMVRRRWVGGGGGGLTCCEGEGEGGEEEEEVVPPPLLRHCYCIVSIYRWWR